MNESLDQIRKDIFSFNNTNTELEIYNIKRMNAPYFINNKSPFYVYDLPTNYYGLYNMIGNVSELVEEKVVKGGSYLDEIANCRIKKDGLYEGAAPNIGFRTICEIKSIKN